MRNKLLIRILALVLVPMLAFAAWAQPARASSNIPTLSATLGRYGFDLSWNSIDAALSYIVRVHYYSSADGVRDWYEDFLVNAPTTTMHFAPSVTGWYNFTIRSVLGLSNSSWSGFTPRTFFNVPAPTPDPSTPDPFVYTPEPISPIPLPTSEPVLLPGTIKYNYYTFSAQWGYLNPSYNRSGVVYNDFPPAIMLPFVSSSFNLPVVFNSSNSVVGNGPGDYEYFHYVSVILNFASPLTHDYTVSLSAPALAVEPLAPLIDEQSLNNGKITVTVSSHNGSVQTSVSSFDSSLQLLRSGISVSLPYDGVSSEYRVSFSLHSDDYLWSTGERLPYYLNLNSVSVQLSSPLITPSPDPGSLIIPEVHNALREQTTVIGRFFSALWHLLDLAFGGVLDSLFAGFGGVTAAIRAAALDLIDAIDLSTDYLVRIISRGFTDTLNLIDYSTGKIVNSIDTGFSELGSTLKDMFIPNVRDLDRLMARIRDSVEPEDGSLLAFPHEVEMELLTIFADDYSSEPPPIELQEFSMQLQGQSYVVFPRLNISLSTIFPSEFLTYVRTFGDITLGMWVLYLITNKVRKLLNLWYSED